MDTSPYICEKGISLEAVRKLIPLSDKEGERWSLIHPLHLVMKSFCRWPHVSDFPGARNWDKIGINAVWCNTRKSSDMLQEAVQGVNYVESLKNTRLTQLRIITQGSSFSVNTRWGNSRGSILLFFARCGELAPLDQDPPAFTQRCGAQTRSGKGHSSQPPQ